MGSILFVHGTGVRLDSYQPTFREVTERAAESKIPHTIAECAWGDALGVDFKGLSLPKLPKPDPDAEQEARRWSWLDEDPFFEHRVLISAPAGPEKEIPGQKPAHEQLQDTISAYQPSIELNALLDRAGLKDLWNDTWTTIVKDPLTAQAIEAAGTNTADSAITVSRALVAQLAQTATLKERTPLGVGLRLKLVDRLRTDWGQQVYGLGDLVKRFLRGGVRKLRPGMSKMLAPVLGDIILYQTRGKEIQEFIRAKIALAKPPVYLLAHSLGGIACVDLLALPNPPEVQGLITAGSQAPLLYELGALSSVTPGKSLPKNFPKWLNLYDPDDVLGYVASRCFPQVRDVEVRSGEFLLGAHSGYWSCDLTWEEIKRFVAN
jgi:hypothetical protein